MESTIDILMDYAYHCDGVNPPEIPEHVMLAMLRLCTNKSPFRAPDGKLFYQVDGIAMGSPLGVLFSQAFMAHVEQTVLYKILFIKYKFLEHFLEPSKISLSTFKIKAIKGHEVKERLT